MKRALAATLLGIAAAGATASACSIGQGSAGSFVRGELDAPECWKGPFDLQPDYFAAVPFQLGDSLMIKVQRGGDFQNYSDGLFISIEKLAQTRARIAAGGPQTLTVGLPPEVTPPGVPIEYDPDPPRVHMTLYLQRSCRPQNPTLQAVKEVALGPNGECSRCGPRGSIGRSNITFSNLFSGNPDETRATERLTKASFLVYLSDPRETCDDVVSAATDGGSVTDADGIVVADAAAEGGSDAGRAPPAPPCRGILRGDIEFYFQRGKPAQPFP